VYFVTLESPGGLRGEFLELRSAQSMETKLMTDLADRVVELVARQLGADRDKVTSEAHFIDDLGADSLDVVELVMEIEEEFGIAIPDADAEKIQTVGEAIRYVEHAKR
jgi:acyl carrier protein